MRRKTTHSKNLLNGQAAMRLRHMVLAPVGAVALLFLVVYLMGFELSQAQAAVPDAPSETVTVAAQEDET
jgi:hypothetical protein